MSHHFCVYKSIIQTELGTMIVITDATTLYLLEFTDRSKLERQISRLKKILHLPIMEGETPLLASIQQALQHYFSGKIKDFEIPLFFTGSLFQKAVWKTLLAIPPGETRSYAQIAAQIGKPRGVRAVANAVGANPVAIIVPCHRVIASDAGLGGYAGGLARKKWLLEHEQQIRAQL